MAFDIDHAAFLIALPPALAAAVWDLKTMTIPNRLAGATAALFLVFCFATLSLEDALWRLGAAALVLGVGFLLFIAGVMGGGDAKLAAAYAPLIPPADGAAALAILAVSALLGLLALALLRFTPLSRGSWAVWSDRRHFPYAVALSMALLVYLALAAFAV